MIVWFSQNAALANVQSQLASDDADDKAWAYFSTLSTSSSPVGRRLACSTDQSATPLATISKRAIEVAAAATGRKESVMLFVGRGRYAETVSRDSDEVAAILAQQRVSPGTGAEMRFVSSFLSGFTVDRVKLIADLSLFAQPGGQTNARRHLDDAHGRRPVFGQLVPGRPGGQQPPSSIQLDYGLIQSAIQLLEELVAVCAQPHIRPVASSSRVTQSLRTAPLFASCSCFTRYLLCFPC